MTHPASFHDTLIIGAGPAGSALAYFLAARGREVLLLDKRTFPRDKTCGDGLSPRALHVLREMDLLKAVLSAGFRINRIRLFAPGGRLVEAPIPAFGTLPDFALVLPRLQLDNLIRERAVRAGAEFRAPVTVTDLVREGGRFVGVRVTTPTGPQEMRARQMVLATGASIGLLERAQLLPAPPAFGRAARTYYDHMRGLSDAIEFHFDSVPLPGYGWVFPTSPTTANVGAGYLARGTGRPPMRRSPQQVFDEFIRNSHVADLLTGARVATPIKGYPLRFDFPTARLAFPGLILIGEACGLVNPLTGEGIDYALESAQVAAEALSAAHTPETYTRALHARFLKMFVNIARVRDVYLRPWVFNRFAAAANRSADLALLLVHIALGNLDPMRALSPKTLVQIALG